jgi:hypothetical protein
MTIRTFDTTSYGRFGTLNTVTFFGGPVAGGGGLPLVAARVCYIDSASPLGTLTSNLNTYQTYTLGEKVNLYRSSNIYGTYTIGYAVCVTAGTTGSFATWAESARIPGYRQTFGTATFSYRSFSSWNTAFAGGIPNSNQQYRIGLHHSDSIYTSDVPGYCTGPVFLVASTSVFDPATGARHCVINDTGSLNTQYYPNRINHISSQVISVSKAAWPATTFAAGAAWRTADDGGSGDVCSSSMWAGYTAQFRGITYDSTFTGESSYTEDLSYKSTDMRGTTFYDCTFRSAGRDAPIYELGPQTIMCGQRHVTRCTINSAATAGVPFSLAGAGYSNQSGGGIQIPGLPPGATGDGIATSLDACTFIRNLSTNVAPIFTHTQFKANQITNPSTSVDHAYIFGGDCSGIQGALTGMNRVFLPAFQYNSSGGIGRLVTFGVKANAASYPLALTTDEAIPEHWLTMDGTTAIGEIQNNWGYRTDNLPGQKTWIRDTAVYRTGGATDGAANYSLRGVWSLPIQTTLLYEYAFHNKKVDGPYTITHEIQFSNTAGSGITGLGVDDAYMTVVYPCSPLDQETDWASSAPDPMLVGWDHHESGEAENECDDLPS